MPIKTLRDIEEEHEDDGLELSNYAKRKILKAVDGVKKGKTQNFEDMMKNIRRRRKKK